MKFEKGDLIIYGETGVCRVEDIVPRVFLDKDQLCYKLSPVYQSCLIFTPVEGSNVSMRPVISRENAETLIKNVSSVPPSDYSVSSPRELSAKYDTIIKSLDFNQWLELFVSIRTKKEIAISNKKKVSAIDERYGKKSEELLYGELAAALGVTKSDIALRFEEELSR